MSVGAGLLDGERSCSSSSHQQTAAESSICLALNLQQGPGLIHALLVFCQFGTNENHLERGNFNGELPPHWPVGNLVVDFLD